MKTVLLNTAARRFGVHPRTILRALSDATNVYWNEDFNPKLDVTLLANSYSMQEKILLRVLYGKDLLMKPVDAASELKVPTRTFRWRKYQAAARHGGIVRYSRTQIVNEHLLKWDAEGTFLDI